MRDKTKRHGTMHFLPIYTCHTLGKWKDKSCAVWPDLLFDFIRTWFFYRLIVDRGGCGSGNRAGRVPRGRLMDWVLILPACIWSVLRQGIEPCFAHPRCTDWGGVCVCVFLWLVASSAQLSRRVHLVYVDFFFCWLKVLKMCWFVESLMYTEEVMRFAKHQQNETL